MYINRLVLRNFKKYKNADIKFQEGLTGIIGGNGAGKSTIVEAIAWALYGNRASTVDKKFIKNANCRPEDSVEVCLTLSLGKKEVRVCRRMKGKNLLPDAELYVNGHQVAKGVHEVDSHLARLLKIGFQDFMRTFYAKQKDLDNLIREGGAGKREYLLKLLGLEDIRESGLEITKEDLKDIENRINHLSGALSELGDVDKRIDGILEKAAAAREEVRKREKAREEAEILKGKARENLELLEEKRHTHELLQKEIVHIRISIQDKEKTIAEERKRLDEIEKQKKRLAELALSRDRLKDVRRMLSEMEPLHDIYERLRSERLALDATRKEAIRSLAVIRSDLEDLYKCRSEVQGLKDIVDRYTKTKSELERLERKREEFSSMISAFHGLDARRSGLVSRYKERSAYLKELRAAEKSLPDINKEIAHLDSLKSELKALEGAKERRRRFEELSMERSISKDKLDNLVNRLDSIRGRISALGDLSNEERALKGRELEIEDLITALNKERLELHKRGEVVKSRIREATENLEKIKDLKADSLCPTCERPLGEQYALLTEKYRKEIAKYQSELEGIEVDLKIVNEKNEGARREKDKIKDELELLSKKSRTFASLEAEQKEIARQISEIKKRLSEIDETLESLGPCEYDPERHAEVERALSIYDRLLAERAALQERMREVPRVEKEIEKTKCDLSELENEALQMLKSLTRIEYDERSYLEARSIISELQGSYERYRQLEMRIREIGGLEERLRSEEKRIRQIDGKILSIEEEISKLGFDPDIYEKLRGEKAKLEKIESEAIYLERAITEEERIRSGLEDAESAIFELGSKMRELQEKLELLGYSDALYADAKRSLELAEIELKQAASAYEKACEDLKKLEWNLEELNRALERKRTLENELEFMNRRAQVITTVRDILVRFMDSLLVRVRKEIADNAARIMEEVTGKYSILTIDDDFNILVDDRGTDYPISRFSGGEIDMIALSVRIAISEYLMRLSGEESGCSFVILDEVFGSQDVEHRERMINMLRSLGDRFPQLFAISHISDVQGQFDNTIVVSEDDAGNSIAHA